jgi:hypothetical protein
MSWNLILIVGYTMYSIDWYLQWQLATLSFSYSDETANRRSVVERWFEKIEIANRLRKEKKKTTTEYVTH